MNVLPIDAALARYRIPWDHMRTCIETKQCKLLRLGVNLYIDGDAVVPALISEVPDGEIPQIIAILQRHFAEPRLLSIHSAMQHIALDPRFQEYSYRYVLSIMRHEFPTHRNGKKRNAFRLPLTTILKTLERRAISPRIDPA